MTIGTPTTATAATFTHVSTSGTECLVVGCDIRGNGSAGTVTGVTYNGVAMTQGSVYNNGINIPHVALFYLLSPASGSHSVAITYAGDTLQTISAYAVDLAAGVDTTTPLGYTTNGTGDTTTPKAVTLSPQTITGYLFSSFIFHRASAMSAPTATTQTQITNVDLSGAAGNDYYACQGYNPATAKTFTWAGTWDDNVYAAMEIRGTHANPGTFGMMGV